MFEKLCVHENNERNPKSKAKRNLATLLDASDEENEAEATTQSCKRNKSQNNLRTTTSLWKRSLPKGTRKQRKTKSSK